MPKTQKLTHEFVKKFFSDNGCELLSTEYKNARTHLDYRCSCGNVSRIIFDSFRRGHRCNTCAQKVRNQKLTYTLEYVKKFFRKHGCELLSDMYENSHDLLVFQCHCGNESKITFNNFRERKRCGNCGIEARSGENHYEWIKDRVKAKNDNALRRRCYSALTLLCKRIGIQKDANKKIYGYRASDLFNHLINHHNWKNVKDQEWHIDHVFPIKAFLDMGIKEPRIINSLDNLQPILSRDNLQKADKYDRNKFIVWLQNKGITINEVQQCGLCSSP